MFATIDMIISKHRKLFKSRYFTNIRILHSPWTLRLIVLLQTNFWYI